MTTQRVTMRDVAAASGVSPATVSFVLNNAAGQTISPATRDRVERAAAELGYVPHGIARALREGASRIVVLNISSGLEGNYSRSFIRGLDDELSRHDHLLLVQHQDMTAKTRQQVLDLINPREVLQFAGRYLADYEPDDEEWEHGFAGHQATQVKHLADRGHTRLAMAIPAERPPLSEMRFDVASEAVRRLGLPELRLLLLDESTREASAISLRHFLDAHPDITAVAGFLDDTGLRVVKAALDLGLQVPGDLAVIGYDATAYAALTTPSLTTVLIDAEVHGRQAARQVLGLDASDLNPAPARIVLGAST